MKLKPIVLKLYNEKDGNSVRAASIVLNGTGCTAVNPLELKLMTSRRKGRMTDGLHHTLHKKIEPTWKERQVEEIQEKTERLARKKE